MTIFETLRKMMLAGFGAQEKFSEFVNELVKKGELSESQGAKLTKEWSDKAEKGTSDLNKTFSDMVTKTLEKMNIPTKDDLKKLDKKISALSSRVKHLEEGGGAK
jgi:poly(hydroxyalkanoate) granule-associated protein